MEEMVAKCEKRITGLDRSLERLINEDQTILNQMTRTAISRSFAANLCGSTAESRQNTAITCLASVFLNYAPLVVSETGGIATADRIAVRSMIDSAKRWSGWPARS